MSGKPDNYGREWFGKCAKESFKLDVSEERLDEMYEESERSIELFKLEHPHTWAAAEERARQAEQVEEVC